MSTGDITSLILGAVQGLAASTLFLLALIIGFCVVLGFPKLRARGAKSRVFHSLEESLGSQVHYLPPDAPRGQVDQLKTPELLEALARKSG